MSFNDEETNAIMLDVEKMMKGYKIGFVEALLLLLIYEVHACHAHLEQILEKIEKT